MKFFKFLWKLIIFIIILLLIVTIALSIYGYFVSKKILMEKPLEQEISQIRNKESYTTLDTVNPNFTNALVSVEDRRFYMHKGFDPISFIRALYTNIKNQELEQGGSTITQQLAKNIYFSNKQVLIRKVAELFVGFEIEKNYQKDEILELYINTIYYGDNYYSIKEASLGYFNVAPIDLSLNQATLLAGVPNAPSIYSPSSNIKLAKKRQKHVINSMIETGYLTKAKAEPLLKEIDEYIKNN